MSITLSLQLMTISIVITYREYIHINTVKRNQWLDSYDYVVIGSGAAGSVVAHRLAEDNSAMVLVLEAGDRQTILTDIPGSGQLGTRLIGSQFNWNYRNVKQEYMGLGFVNQTMIENKGKILGGTASVNGMVYNRGNPRDFDNWAQIYGTIGWNYSQVLPFFIKSEHNFDQKLVQQNPGFHGTEGLIGIKTNPNVDKILVYQQKALNELGIPSLDINGAKQLGTTISQSFISSYGLRSTTANAYLDPNPYPKRLHILINSFVTRILFTRDSKNKLIANSVEFIRNGHKIRVRAKREIILCGGAINSPQILMLSGIGPKEHLNQHNIPVLLDLPVENNYKTHPGVVLNYLLKDKSLSIPPGQLNSEQLYQLFTNYTGSLSAIPIAFTYRNSTNNMDNDWPNTALESLTIPFNNNITQNISQYCCHRNEWKEYYKEFVNKSYLNIESAVVRPRSFGTIRLKSNNPFDKPLIDPKFLTNPKDFEDLIEITKFSIFLMQNTWLSKYAFLPSNPIPGCVFCSDRPLYSCNQYIECVIRQIGSSYAHSTGSCRMGSAERSDVVVDPRLRVKNISRLRVCDSSVMPEVVNSNTEASTVMIGEKCSQMVREDNYNTNK